MTLKARLAAALIAAASIPHSPAQWQNLNPGGGGQIQGITCDPATPGRIYITSDVEGAYRSDDYGNAWSYIGQELLHHLAFYTAVEPGNPNRIYCGTLYGLAYSDDAGAHWTNPTTWPMYGQATAAMAIDPNNVSNLYVANSFYNKDQAMPTNKIPGEATTGPRHIWTSKDRGATWHTITYDPAQGYKQCYTITLNPANTTHVYLGAASGLFRSTDAGATFHPIDAPAGFPSCRGMDITPDGQFAYAVFATDQDPQNPQPAVFVAPLATGTAWAWTQIAAPAQPNGLFYQAGLITSYWKPLVAPHSTPTQHSVILGCMWSQASANQGLYQFNATATGQTITGTWRRQFGTAAPFTFDPGWNNLLPQVRQYTHAPTTWPPAHQGAVCMASQQSLYYGYPALPDTDPNKWTPISTQANGYAAQFPLYATRGFQSTVTFDAAGWQNYLIQGQADNRLIESWDSGLSWTQASRPAGGENADYTDVIPPDPTHPPLVITACGGGFAGANDAADAAHWAKYLSTPPSPNDTWVSLETGLSGLPAANSRTYGSAVDPTNPSHIILATQAGLFETQDIHARIAGTGGTFVQISPAQSYKGGDVWFHATNPNAIYAHNATALLRGTKTGITWAYATLATPLEDATYWQHNATDYLAYTADETLYLSTDGGTTFAPVLTRPDILALYTAPWLGTWADGTPMTFHINGLAGHADKLYCTVNVPYAKHGYTALAGTIAPNGSITWQDWRGDTQPLEVPHLWDAKIVSQQLPDGTPAVFYYAATRGGGLWRRPITPGPAALNVAWHSFQAQPAGPRTVTLTWATTHDPHNDRFEIFRALDTQTTFTRIQTLPPAATHTHTAADTLPPHARAAHYYIQQVDTDGSTTQSHIQSVYLHHMPYVTAHPNPATTSIHITSSHAPIKALEICLPDGRVLPHPMPQPQTETHLDLRALPPGIYTLRITTPEGQTTLPILRQ